MNSNINLSYLDRKARGNHDFAHSPPTVRGERSVRNTWLDYLFLTMKDCPFNWIFVFW
ncbi:MAG: hypothetical protein ACFFCV_07050 [Promethearchaeota archaeon]